MMVDLNAICQEMRSAASRDKPVGMPHDWSIDVLDDLARYLKKNGLLDAAQEVASTCTRVKAMLDLTDKV